MNITVGATPNPNAFKFSVEKTLVASGSVHFKRGDDTSASPLAGELFILEAVTEILISSNFVTVNHAEGTDWNELEPQVKAVIEKVLAKGEAVTVEEKKVETGEGLEGDELITFKIKKILDEEIRPAVAQDGGDIIFYGYKEGIVTLHLQGACSSCPSSIMTLRMGVENRLKHEIPEIITIGPAPQMDEK